MDSNIYWYVVKSIDIEKSKPLNMICNGLSDQDPTHLFSCLAITVQGTEQAAQTTFKSEEINNIPEFTV